MRNPKKTSEKKKGGVRAFLSQRSTRRGTVSIVITVLFIAAIFLLNIVMSAVTDRKPLYIDVTENASYRLQQETEDFLDTVSKPVDLYVLQKEADFESGDSLNYKYRIQANKLLHAIEAYSDNVELHYIDLDATPTFTAPYPKVNWTESHAILAVCGDQYRAVDLTDMFTFDQEQYYYNNTIVIKEQKVEQAILSAIANITADKLSKVTVLSGQGEQDLSSFVTLLKNNAYEVENVSLLDGSIADDSEFVIIYAPNVDISEEIYTTLSEWLNNDGKFGHNLMYIPDVRYDQSELPNLSKLLADYGMELPFGYIQDSKYAVSQDAYVTMFDYSDDTTYTNDLRNPSIPIVMYSTTPVTVTDTSLAKPLLLSSDEAVMASLDEDENVQTSDKGVLNGAAIGIRNDGTEDGESSCVVVVGSPFALSGNYLSNSSFNNAAYFVNLFNLLTEHEDVGVVIEGKDPSAKDLGVTSLKSVQAAAVFVRFILPIAVLAAGLFVWIKRRHQ